ncbi:Spy/CpxP family protein refolding chaperone [Lichenicoccus sp.]|uniref:Spy/CpxP family protein refolding chaperone n=1 Tax=Lichenicoccus sp. TaxID=2781899 RepID=UPI003D0BE465
MALLAFLAAGPALLAPPVTLLASAAAAQTEAPALAPSQSPAEASLGRPAASLSQSGMRSRLGRQQAEALEAHITTLHRTWHITTAQEPLWGRLTGAMRHGAVQLDAAYARREQQNAGANAVEDLRAYALVQQTHASNAADLLAPFGSLYDSFSPAQKHIADETVRHFTDNALKAPR